MADAQGSAWTEDRVIAIVRELAAEDEVPEHLKTAEITGADTVESLGLDSIGAVALIDRLETEAGTALPDDFIDLNDSVSVIVERLNGMA